VSVEVPAVAAAVAGAVVATVAGAVAAAVAGAVAAAVAGAVAAAVAGAVVSAPVAAAVVAYPLAIRLRSRRDCVVGRKRVLCVYVSENVPEVGEEVREDTATCKPVVHVVG
jgi:O-antigen/teichoic acid export membrane protein